MNTLETSLELPVTVEYDCLDEGGIEITRIFYEDSKVVVIINLSGLSQIQYDCLISEIESDIEGQKQDSLDFQAECIRDDKLHDPDW